MAKAKQKNTVAKKSGSAAKGKRDVGKQQPSDGNGETSWSKSKRKKMRKLKAKLLFQLQNNKDEKVIDNSTKVEAVLSKEGPDKKSKKLMEVLKNRLSGGRFRELNEVLYTSSSDAAYEKFSSEPALFEQYHVGFRNQIKSWPVNPVDVIYKWLLKLPEEKNRKIVIADFGCGDAQLAKALQNNDHFQVHSFDLVCHDNPFVTACDMSNVPLVRNCLDVAVFSLALMGTNIADFMREAHRVLRIGGILKIAEVRSRFETPSTKKVNGKGKKGCTLLNDFMVMMESLGFLNEKLDRTNKLFFLMEFKKLDVKPDENAQFTAKACIYKRR